MLQDKKHILFRMSFGEEYMARNESHAFWSLLFPLWKDACCDFSITSQGSLNKDSPTWSRLRTNWYQIHIQRAYSSFNKLYFSNAQLSHHTPQCLHVVSSPRVSRTTTKYSLVVPRNISSRFSESSEANASELLENPEEIFLENLKNGFPRE